MFSLLMIIGRNGGGGALPGDNPVYDSESTAITLRGLLRTTAPVHYVNASSNTRARADSASERELDNPIYGGNEAANSNNVYTNPNDQTGWSGMESVPDHEFDNPIYGGETDENTYSMPPDSLAAPGHAQGHTSTMTDVGQKVYENIGGGPTGNDLVYDSVDY